MFHGGVFPTPPPWHSQTLQTRTASAVTSAFFSPQNEHFPLLIQSIALMKITPSYTVLPSLAGPRNLAIAFRQLQSVPARNHHDPPRHPRPLLTRTLTSPQTFHFSFSLPLILPLSLHGGEDISIRGRQKVRRRIHKLMQLIRRIPYSRIHWGILPILQRSVTITTASKSCK